MRGRQRSWQGNAVAVGVKGSRKDNGQEASQRPSEPMAEARKVKKTNAKATASRNSTWHKARRGGA